LRKALIASVLFFSTVPDRVLSQSRQFTARETAASSCCGVIAISGPPPTREDMDHLCNQIQSEFGAKYVIYATFVGSGAKAFAARGFDEGTLEQWGKAYERFTRQSAGESAADLVLNRAGCRLRLQTGETVITLFRPAAGGSTLIEKQMLSDLVYLHLAKIQGGTQAVGVGIAYFKTKDVAENARRFAQVWPTHPAGTFQILARSDTCFGNSAYYPQFHPLEREKPCVPPLSNEPSIKCDNLGPEARCRLVPQPRH
jgi:hypothetical protein